MMLLCKCEENPFNPQRLGSNRKLHSLEHRRERLYPELMCPCYLTVWINLKNKCFLQWGNTLFWYEESLKTYVCLGTKLAVMLNSRSKVYWQTSMWSPKNTHYSSLILQNWQRFSLLVPTLLSCWLRAGFNALEIGQFLEDFWSLSRLGLLLSTIY